MKRRSLKNLLNPIGLFAISASLSLFSPSDRAAAAEGLCSQSGFMDFNTGLKPRVVEVQDLERLQLNFPSDLAIARVTDTDDRKWIVDLPLQNKSGLWSWSVSGQPLEIQSRRFIIEGTSLVREQKYQTVVHRYSLGSAIRSDAKAPDRNHIFLNHGLGRSGSYFHDLVRILVSQGFTVHVIDGVNSGASLELMAEQKLGASRGAQYVHAPSPLDDMLVWRTYLSHPENKNLSFSLVGHSRGHAVTSSWLATGELDAKLISHIPINPYLEWMLDAPSQASDRSPISQAIANRSYAWTNQLAISSFRALARRFELELEAHEQTRVNSNVTANALVEILSGLLGANRERAGFSVLPFYKNEAENEIAESTTAQTEPEPDFGFAKLGQLGLKIQPLTQEIKDRTVFIASEDDPLVSPRWLDAKLKTVGYQLPMILPEVPRTEDGRALLLQGLGDNAVLKARKTLRATHLSPSQLPLQLAEMIMAIHAHHAARHDFRRAERARREGRHSQATHKK